MDVNVSEHPLVAHKLSYLRSNETSSPLFRQLTRELVTLVTYEATKKLELCSRTISTPVTSGHQAQRLVDPRILAVPILRAGLGMLDGFLDLVPTAEVGFLGIRRDEQTLQPETYANRLPESLKDRHIFILDPMLATGGTLIDSIGYVTERGAKRVTVISLITSPEGVEALQKQFGHESWDLQIYLGALDEKLNDVGYIVPGLGDAGDRLFGTVG